MINNFEVMHDAEKCLGYTFEYEGKKLSYASDVGCVNNIIKENLKNSDVIVLESNYDYNMLMTGPYHWELKKRVKGRNGHLSNAEASKLIGQVLCEKLKKVYLMHISKDNNTPELAYNSLYQILEREIKAIWKLKLLMKREQKFIKYRILEIKNKEKVMWNDLKLEIDICTKCILEKTRINPIVGEGNKKAEILFVLDSISEEEDVKQKLLIDRNGKYFKKFLEYSKLDLKKCYFTTLTKCSSHGNLIEKDSITKCNEFLVAQIALINPKYIVTVGEGQLNHF